MALANTGLLVVVLHLDGLDISQNLSLIDDQILRILLVFYIDFVLDFGDGGESEVAIDFSQQFE